MSKIETIYQIAIDAGLPDDITVTYHRGGRVWYVQHPIPMGASAEIGNPSTIIGNYDSVQAARDQLPRDAQRFHEDYGRVLQILDGDMTDLTNDERRLLQDAPLTVPAGTYAQFIKEGIATARRKLASQDYIHELTPLGKRLASMLTDHHDILSEHDTPRAAETRHDVISKRDALHRLFDLLERGEPVDTALIDSARAYVDALETDAKHDATTYESKYPTLPKAAIHWQQPTNRKAPVYTHEFNCAVCGQSVSIQTHSPNAPSVCDRDDCQTEHRRTLARGRKRKQRARAKTRLDKKR